MARKLRSAASPAPGESVAAGAPVSSWDRLRSVKRVVVAIASVGAVLGGLAGYWNVYKAARESSAVPVGASAEPAGRDHPLSIVVLPFANRTGDATQEYLADGLTAAVSTDLTRIRSAFVVSTASAFSYKGKAVAMQQLGRELGVRFALQGGVQRSGDLLRVDAELSDTTTGGRIWAEVFKGSSNELFALQEQITTRISNSIGLEMVILAARDSERRQSRPGIGDLMLRAEAALFRPESHAKWTEAQAFLRQALAIEPDNTAAMARLARVLSTEAWNGYVSDAAQRNKLFEEARDWALKAQGLGSTDSQIFATLSDYASVHGDQPEAVRLAEKAVEYEPRRASRYNDLGGALLLNAEPERAVEVLTRGFPLADPDVRRYFYLPLAQAHFLVGHDDQTIDWAHHELDVNPRSVQAMLYLALAYARKGDLVRLRPAATALTNAEPDLRLSTLLGSSGDHHQGVPAYWELRKREYSRAWRMAGLPE